MNLSANQLSSSVPTVNTPSDPPDFSSFSNLAVAEFWAGLGWDMGPVRREINDKGKATKRSALMWGDRVFSYNPNIRAHTSEWRKRIKPYLFEIFPNRPDVSPSQRGKVKGGFHKHTQDGELLEVYFKNSDLLVGMTGPATLVIDLDNIKDWPEKEVKRLVSLCEFVVKTPSGGYHLYFRHQYQKNGSPSRVGLGDREGFGKEATADLKWGATGYWMAPGSKSNTEDERRYEIIKGRPCRPEQMKELPKEIIEFFGIGSGKSNNRNSKFSEEAGYLRENPDKTADEAYVDWLKIAHPKSNRGASFFDFMVNYVCAVPKECERVEEFVKKALKVHPDLENRIMRDHAKFLAKSVWTLDYLSKHRSVEKEAEFVPNKEVYCESQEELAEFIILDKGEDYAHTDGLGGAIWKDRWWIDYSASQSHPVEAELVSEYGKKHFGSWRTDNGVKKWYPNQRTSGQHTFRRGTTIIIHDKMLSKGKSLPRTAWESNPLVLGGPDGKVFDLTNVDSTSTIESITRPERRDDRILYHIGASPSPTYSNWLKLWTENQSDEEIRRYAESLIGYGLFCTGLEHIFVVCAGPRRSGKSLLCNALRHALRTLPLEANALYHTASPRVFKHTPNKQDSHRHIFIGLERARIVGCPEFGDSILDVETMKTITGGDEITADQKHKAEYSFTCRNLPILVSNDNPQLLHPDPAINARVRFIPNWRHIEKDKRLVTYQELVESEEMRSEVFGWALYHAIQYQIRLRESGGKTGLIQEPELAKTARLEWLGRSNAETRFLDAFELDFTKKYGVLAAEFYAMARAYSRSENVRWSKSVTDTILRDARNYFVNQGKYNDTQVKSLFSKKAKVGRPSKTRQVHYLKLKEDHEHDDLLGDLIGFGLHPDRWKNHNGIITQSPLLEGSLDDGDLDY